jgi:hypothetical protein
VATFGSPGDVQYRLMSTFRMGLFEYQRRRVSVTDGDTGDPESEFGSQVTRSDDAHLLATFDDIEYE